MQGMLLQCLTPALLLSLALRHDFPYLLSNTFFVLQ